jgi:hypothetical protein
VPPAFAAHPQQSSGEYPRRPTVRRQHQSPPSRAPPRAHAGLKNLDRGDELDVVGALCFPNVEGLPWLGQIEIRAIVVDGPKPVSRLAARPGQLDSETVERICPRLPLGLT